MSGRIEIDSEAIRELARLLDETGLAEIEISHKESRLRVARTVQQFVQAAPVAASAPMSTASAPVPVAPSAALSEAMGAEHPGALKSPMVGVAWLRPDPGTKSFVQPGERVTEGQTVLLIEAMKTFNQIKAHRSGTVVRILVADGAPVEYAELLMLIE